MVVGYEYQSCTNLIWKTLVTTVEGYDPSVSKFLGPWTLNVHHTYHADKATLYLGNGGKLRLSDQPQIMTTAMGNGLSRHDACTQCNGKIIRVYVLFYYIIGEI